MTRVKFAGVIIESAGYDPQCAWLDIRFTQDGHVLRYYEVEEELWYRFKKQVLPDDFFHQYVKGRYREEQVT